MRLKDILDRRALVAGVLALALALCAPILAVAQEVLDPPRASTGPSDHNFLILSLIFVVGGYAVSFGLDFLKRRVFTFVPAAFWPIVVPAAGVGIAWLETKLSGTGSTNELVLYAITVGTFALKGFRKAVNEHGLTLPSTSVKAIAVILCLGIGLSGCASTGPKKAAFVGLATTHEAMNLAQDTLLIIECGKPSAPTPPVCVPADKANEAHRHLSKAYRVHAEATDVAALADLKPEDKIRVFQAIAEVWQLVDTVKALFFPAKDQPAVINLNARVAELKAAQ